MVHPRNSHDCTLRPRTAVSAKIGLFRPPDFFVGNSVLPKWRGVSFGVNYAGADALLQGDQSSSGGLRGGAGCVKIVANVGSYSLKGNDPPKSKKSGEGVRTPNQLEQKGPSGSRPRSARIHRYFRGLEGCSRQKKAARPDSPPRAKHPRQLEMMSRGGTRGS